MKKLMLVIALAVTMISAGVAFAWSTPGTELTMGSTVSSIFKPSTNVSMEYTGEAAGLGYIAGAYNSSGTKSYGASSGDTKIWVVDGTSGTLPSTAPAGTASVTWGSGWSAQ